MNRIVVPSQVGADGFVAVRIPVGKAKAGHAVIVTVEEAPAMTREEWQRFIDETAGSWQGDVKRPNTAQPEQRTEWP